MIECAGRAPSLPARSFHRHCRSQDSLKQFAPIWFRRRIYCRYYVVVAGRRRASGRDRECVHCTAEICPERYGGHHSAGTFHAVGRVNRPSVVRTDVPNVLIDGYSVRKVESSRFLGVVINSSLDWNNHINLINIKVSKTIGILKYVKNKLPDNILRSLYFTLVNPYYEYCNIVWAVKIQYYCKNCLSHKKGYSDYY